MAGKEFWDSHSLEKHPILKEHTASTHIWSCSKCLDFLPVKDQQMWQDNERRWPNHAAHHHKDCDFFVDPTGKMSLKNPANNSGWWPLNPGNAHYDETLQAIKEISKSLPHFCLPTMDGNIFSVTENNLIGCTKCGYCYPRQVKGTNNGWENKY